MRSPRPTAAAVLVGVAVFLIGMAVGGTGSTYAAYSDFAVLHNSARAGVWDDTSAQPQLPTACTASERAGTPVRRGTDGADHLTAGGGDRVVLMGLGGDDVLVAGPGRDCLVGGTGRDTCVGVRGTAVFVGCEVIDAPDRTTDDPTPSTDIRGPSAGAIQPSPDQPAASPDPGPSPGPTTDSDPSTPDETGPAGSTSQTDPTS